jgi:hypothetical protein
MKLADDALLQIIDFLRQGLVDNKDVSELLRGLNLHPNGEGKLSVAGPAVPTAWSQQDSETD